MSVELPGRKRGRYKTTSPKVLKQNSTVVVQSTSKQKPVSIKVETPPVVKPVIKKEPIKTQEFTDPTSKSAMRLK